jgi:NAD-dependent SIR2 family protein deacetylase
MTNQSLVKAAEVIDSADCLLIIAGAGMGVDSGLPDFRGSQGFWKIHPNFKKEGLSFQDLANPQWFFNAPNRAWGFYGHRYQLYQKTEPHQGFQLLKKWSDAKSIDSFVYTSNVDGHFQKSGFSEQRVYECHGSINYLQCRDCCTDKIWSLPQLNLQIDVDQQLATGELPNCPLCGEIARPNILMFNDGFWLSNRSDQQNQKYKQWKKSIQDKTVAIIELGAGISGCSVRGENRQISEQLIRINPTDAEGNDKTVSIQLGALEALLAIDKLLTH